MEFSVKMQPELMISTIWLIVGLAILLTSIILLIIIIVFKKAPKKEKVKKERPPKPNFYEEIELKNRTVSSIDKIIHQLNNNEIDVRESYQRLSITLREFVTRVTGKKYTTLSLSELKKMNLEVLAQIQRESYTIGLKKDQFDKFEELIEVCYAPEFALKTEAEFKKDAEKAKGMVKTWN